MKKIALAVLAVLCCTLPSLAQDWAKERLGKSPRHQEWVDIKYGNRVVHAFVVYPEVKSKAPAVLVIHEIFGLTDWARSAADQVAAAEITSMRYRAESRVIQKKANEKKKDAAKQLDKSTHTHHQANFFDMGELGVELALVLSSVAILTKRASYWYAGLIVGAGHKARIAVLDFGTHLGIGDAAAAIQIFGKPEK